MNLNECIVELSAVRIFDEYEQVIKDFGFYYLVVNGDYLDLGYDGNTEDSFTKK